MNDLCSVTNFTKEDILDFPKVAVVVPTLSAPQSLERLLSSLASQTLPPVEVIVVVQRNRRAAEEAILKCLPGARVVSSPEGLSRARNVGIKALASDWDIVALPDDDIVYEDDTLETAAAHIISGAEGLCGRVRSGDPNTKERMAFQDHAVRLNQHNVWKTTIEAGYVLSRKFFDVVGYYDERLGLGADTPWGSGEGTDLLLRGLEKRLVLVYCPDVSMREIEELQTEPLPPANRRVRLRAYARGTGRVYRLRYGVLSRYNLILKSCARFVLRGLASKGKSLRDDRAILLGRVEGLAGRTFDGIAT